MARFPITTAPSALKTFLQNLGAIGNLFQSATVSNEVVPVGIVDSEVNIPITSPTFGTPASAGEIIAPAANTRLANTGAQPAGNYGIQVFVFENEVAGNAFRLRRRNALDTADVWSIRFGSNAPAFLQINPMKVTLLSNEFLVVENVSAGGAGITYQASIFIVAS